jgi:hypothetical protein
MSKTFWKKKPEFQIFVRFSNEIVDAAELIVGSAAPGKFSPKPSMERTSSPTAWPPHEMLAVSWSMISSEYEPT